MWRGRAFLASGGGGVPRGFGKFFPKGSASSAGGEGASATAGKGKVNFGGGGGGKKPESDGQMRNLIFGGSAIAALFFMLSSEVKSGREITWQEFQSQLLETGQVDRIIVTNKNVARITLRRPLDGSAPDTGSSSSLPLPSVASMFPPQDDPAASGWRSNLPSPDAQVSPGSGRGGEGADGMQVQDKFARYPRIGSPTSTITPYYFSIGSVESFERKLEEAQRALNISARDFVPVMYVNETSWGAEAMRFAPTILLIGAYFFFMRGAGGGMGGGASNVFKIGKTTAKKIAPEHVTVTFKDVAGCDEAKREIMEFIDFLKDPKRFTDLGAKIPKGALLAGPPGTGKTLLAKATAGEAGVPFFSVSGSEFVEMFVGVGPSRVRDLFKEARAHAPAIIFIDEIDAVGRARGKGMFGGGGNDERENTLNQLLVEMDGFDTTASLVVLAGTNRADILDAALTRAGRFDRQITVDKPDIQGRKAIFDVHLLGLTLAGPISDYSSRLAALTPGFVGADIANMCNEAAIVAARANKAKVELEDFEKATDRIIGGLESKKIMSEEERRIVGAFFPHTRPPCLPHAVSFYLTSLSFSPSAARSIP